MRSAVRKLRVSAGQRARTERFIGLITKND